MNGDYDRLTERERAAVELAERMARDPRSVDEAFLDRLRDHFTDDQLVELTLVCCLNIAGNYFGIAMGIDPDWNFRARTGDGRERTVGD